MTIPNTFVNGTTADADEVNANFTYAITKIKEIYTGAAFDSNLDNTQSTDTNSYELTALTASEVENYDYVAIDITGVAGINNANGGLASVTVTIEAKETGGAYGTLITPTLLSHTSSQATNIVTPTVTWIHTLTAGQKTNGVQFKVTSTSTVAAVNGYANFNNSQTVVRIP